MDQAKSHFLELAHLKGGGGGGGGFGIQCIEKYGVQFQFSVHALHHQPSYGVQYNRGASQSTRMNLPPLVPAPCE